MNVVRVALLLSALLAAAATAPIELPVVQEFQDNGIAVMTNDGEVPYPKAEEESLDTMSVSDGDNFVSDKSSSMWRNIMIGIGIGIGIIIAFTICSILICRSLCLGLCLCFGLCLGFGLMFFFIR